MINVYRAAFNKLINLEKCSPQELTDGRLYYEKYANEEEQKNYEIAYVKYRRVHIDTLEERSRITFNVFLNHDVDTPEFQKLADELEVSPVVVKGYPKKYYEKYATPDEKTAYEEVMKKRAETIQKKEKARIKYFWDYCESVSWDPKKIEELAIKFKLESGTIRRLAIQYAKDELNLTNDDIRKKFKEKTKVQKIVDSKETKFYAIIKKLTELNNEDEIVAMLIENKTSFQCLRALVPQYIAIYESDLPIEMKQSLEQDLATKIDYYVKSICVKSKTTLAKKMTDENMAILPQAIATIEKMIAQEECATKEQFCLQNSVKTDIFDNYLKLIKKYEEDLYKLYSDKMESRKIRKYASVINVMHKIVNGIKNGIIIEEEVIRPFDLIDYYQFTSMPLEEFFGICSEKLAPNELKPVIHFFHKYRDEYFWGELDIKKIMQDIDEVATKKDPNGFPIPGTGRIVTASEKQAIIDFLRKNNIAVSDRTYAIAFRRYVQGMLDLNDNLNNTETEDRGFSKK